MNEDHNNVTINVCTKDHCIYIWVYQYVGRLYILCYFPLLKNICICGWDCHIPPSSPLHFMPVTVEEPLISST